MQGQPIQIPFHLASRDAWVSGGAQALENLFREPVLISDPAKVRLLLKARIIYRSSEMIETLSRLHSASSRKRAS